MIKLNDEPPIDGLRPCANVMYKSLVQCNYDEITCVVLTGMGADGTEGIKTLSASHKKIHVIAQDEDSCVVYGMPKAIAPVSYTHLFFRWTGYLLWLVLHFLSLEY